VPEFTRSVAHAPAGVALHRIEVQLQGGFIYERRKRMSHGLVPISWRGARRRWRNRAGRGMASGLGGRSSRRWSICRSTGWPWAMLAKRRGWFPAIRISPPTPASRLDF